MNIKHHQRPGELAQGLQVKLHDGADVVHDLDKTGPDGSAQTSKERSSICLYHGL